MRAILIAGLGLLLGLSGCRTHAPPAEIPASSAAEARARIGAWGLDLTSEDSSVRPGDDFYQYADGHWMDTHQIPPDRTSWGTFAELAQSAEEKLRSIAASLPEGAPEGSTEQKVGDFYRSYLDTEAIEYAGTAPAQPGLQAIAATRTYTELAALMGRRDLAARAPLRIDINTDQKNPDRYIVTIAQSGLGMPDRDYYLKDDAVYVNLRARYVAHIERVLALAGEKNAAAEATSVLDLETRIARIHWPAAKRRERDLTYNLRDRAQLEQMTPGFPWQELLSSAGIAGQNEFVVRELDAVQSLATLFRQVAIPHWRAYFQYHYLIAMSEVLPKTFDDEAFDFYGRTLNGQPQQRARWKRAIGALDADLGEAIGQLYVERYFPPESKQKMLALVENLRAAYAARIQSLPWMSVETKKVALEKLAAFRPKIGYPDNWRDYSALQVRAGDAFGNSARATLFEWHRQVVRLGKPTDRGEWRMAPQTINAYYNATFNEVVFPAAILQPPFFDPYADDAVNYGAVGAVIGHEMGHGFDDQGSKSDARGVLHSWWLPEDERAFRKRVDSLAAQYDQYIALPGLHVNGRLTLGENIGDLGGLTVAHQAYHMSLHGRAPPVLDGISADQRFFLSWAQTWRALNREEQLRNQVTSDPHSPPRYRVNGAVRNIDAWYDAFDVKPGEKLFLPPEDRVRIW